MAVRGRGEGGGAVLLCDADGDICVIEAAGICIHDSLIT